MARLSAKPPRRPPNPAFPGHCGQRTAIRAGARRVEKRASGYNLEGFEQGALSLDRPTAFWARFFDRPVQPVGNATPEQLNTFLASTELRPGSGVAVAGGAWRVLALGTRDSRAALQLAGRLRADGYAATLRPAAGGASHEVLIERLATRQDAQSVLDRLAATPGVAGRVLL